MNVTVPKMQSTVIFYDSTGVLNAHQAVLEWSENDHITLYTIRRKSTQLESVIFDVPVGSIEKVSGISTLLVFHIAGERYRVNTPLALLQSVRALGTGKKPLPSSNLSDWLNALRSGGVRMQYLSIGTNVSIGIGIALTVTIVGFAIAMIIWAR